MLIENFKWMQITKLGEEFTHYAVVPGGWLFKVTIIYKGIPSTSLQFVPKPKEQK